MSYDPRDCDGDTPEQDRREEDERAELRAQEEEEETNAVMQAAAAWRRSIAIAVRESESA